jgi:hypothetical protein
MKIIAYSLVTNWTFRKLAILIIPSSVLVEDWKAKSEEQVKVGS